MKIKVLQWNVDYQSDIEDVVRVIKSIDPDIVCLQELTLDYQTPHQDTGAYVAEQLGYGKHVVYGHMSLPNGQQTMMGNGIFSRYRLENPSQRLFLQPASMRIERYYIEATISMHDAKVAVGTTHLPLRPSFRTTKYKQLVVEDILAHIPMSGQRIFIGDFNSVPRSKIVELMRKRFSHAGPAWSHKTWTKKPFEIAGYNLEGLNWRIDYVFYADLPRPIKSEIIDTPISDHYPLLTTFEV